MANVFGLHLNQGGLRNFNHVDDIDIKKEIFSLVRTTLIMIFHVLNIWNYTMLFLFYFIV